MSGSLLGYGVSKGFLVGEVILHSDNIKSGPSKISGGCGASVGKTVCGSRRKRCKRQQRPCQRQFKASAVEQNGESGIISYLRR
ncbi:hypothetical protein KCP78_07995 [Salmonella enterica subsp. enterica]|nr:hypothetical protein KCP78_07995 [Salmonella enterica subsp. enterica]